MALQQGTTGDDTIIGLPENDVLDGLAGDDVIVGNAGDDRIEGGAGNDVLAGGDGNDVINGGDGADLITGGASGDRIDGGGGDDVLALSGLPSDYLFTEVSAPTGTTPGIYRVLDRRPGTPDAADIFLNIERFRFGSGPEFTLAELLSRAPSDIVLKGVPLIGPEVRETATTGDFVARLEAIDPDPNDIITFTFASVGGVVQDGGGRFTIDGDILRVARANAFDFEALGSHDVQIVATDSAGQVVFKTINVAVRDDTDAFTALFLTLPADAQSARLWSLDDGGFVVTWRGTVDGVEGWVSRQIDAGGVAVGDPPTPDRLLIASTQSSTGGEPTLLGVDDEGIAAFATVKINLQETIVEGGPFDPKSYSRSYSDELIWVDTHDGQTTQIQSFASSSNASSITTLRQGNPQVTLDSSSGVYNEYRAYSYDDDGYVIFNFVGETSGGASVNTAYAGSSSGFSSVQTDYRAADGSGSDELLTSANYVSASTNGSSTTVGETVTSIDVAADGTVATIRDGTNLFIDGQLKASISNAAFTDVAAIDPTRYAATMTLAGQNGQNVRAQVFNGGSRFTTDFVAPTDHNYSSASVTALGDTRYLVTFIDQAPIATQLRAQVFDAAGKPITSLLTFATDTLFAPNDDGTVVAYRQVTDPNGFVSLEAQVAVADELLITPAAGAFSDFDNDGDLDYRGTIALGYNSGEQVILRLESGSYEIVGNILKVRNATVFAELGSNRTNALFTGSFDIDRGTGVATNFMVGTLAAGEEALKIAGLVPTYKSLTLQKDAAAFGASFALPDGLLGTGAKFEVSGRNALLINAAGPQLGGYEITLPPFASGDVFKAFKLFEVKAKGLKVKYDATIDELGFSGELELKSSLLDGALSVFGKASDAALTFKDFKIKGGLYDFEGEFAIKEYVIREKDLINEKIALKDIKIGIKVDDNVVQSVDVAGGITLPFASFGGITFAGQVLNPPLAINKFGITANVEIPLNHGLFIDSIAVLANNLAPSPPEPVSLPTLYSGTIGLGWGPKFPTIELPAFTGLEPVSEARLINAKLTFTTDFDSAITGTVNVNVLKDEVFKLTGLATWDWDKGSLLVQGEFDLLSGIGKGAIALRISALGVIGQAAANFTLPNVTILGPAAGVTIVGGNILVQLVGDEDQTNDVAALWGTVTLPLVGSVTLGIKVDLITFEVSSIFGADTIPQVATIGFRQALAAALLPGDLPLAAPDPLAGDTFDIAADRAWLMLSASWDGGTATAPRLRVHAPDGTIIEEADFALHDIAVADVLSGDTRRTIVIATPQAGEWSVELVDRAGLGTITYNAYTANPEVGVTNVTAALVAGEPMGQISATLTGVDPGTRVTFWADDDASGSDGFALGGTTVDADGNVTVAFDSALLAGGSYFVYALADDGRGAPASAYSATSITVAHRPTGILLDPVLTAVEPTGDAAATILESATSGTVIGRLSAVNTDPTETHSFSLIDDRGGRFAILGDLLVVGTGAPLDAMIDGSVSLRITSRAGLSVDGSVMLEVMAEPAGWEVIAGRDGTKEVALGSTGRDAFYAFDAGDIVSGRAGDDVLYLVGDRADFEIVVDLTGDITGPVRTTVLLDDFPDLIGPSPLDPPPPYLIIRDLRSGAEPIIVSGVETLQFRDTAIGTAALTGIGPLPDSYTVLEDSALAVDAFSGLLANDAATGLVMLVDGPAHGILSLRADGSFDYTPGADFHGSDSFRYRVGESAPIVVTLVVTPVNDAPVILPGIAGEIAAIALAENAATVALSIAVDVDGDAIQSRIVGGSDAAAFTIDANGALQFQRAANFEVPADHDGDNRYEVIVDADDGALSAMRTILVSITDQPDTLIFAGSAGDDVMRNRSSLDWRASGGDGADFLAGNTRGDVIVGDAGNDHLRGRSGDDWLSGGVGGDFMVGGEGNDRLFGESDDDFLAGREGDDVLNGGDGSDRLVGDDGIDHLFGGDGDDALSSGADDDLLNGGSGSDRLDGGDGNDVLDGGMGRDVLFGGAGADTFRLTSAERALHDVIRDFAPDADRIELSHAMLGLTALETGMIDPARIAFGARAVTVDQRVIYDAERGLLMADADGSGPGSAIVVAYLVNTPVLDIAQIYLI